MENRKYEIERDNIYVGQVVKAEKIYYSNPSEKHLVTCPYTPLRSILFTLTDNNFANDLLYNSPNYPILNLTENNALLSLEKNSIIINQTLNLNHLLIYFNYEELLTFKDILKIRKIFFNGKFAFNNYQLFGWKEIGTRKYLENGKNKFAKKIQNHQKIRFLVETENSILPKEYFYILDELGDHSLYDVLLGPEEKMNAFTPSSEEKNVKKLKLF